MSSTAFGETLQFVTKVKLAELEKRRLAFADHSSTVLSNANSCGDDLILKANVLVEGIKSWSGTWSMEGSMSLDNIEGWLEQVCLFVALVRFFMKLK